MAKAGLGQATGAIEKRRVVGVGTNAASGVISRPNDCPETSSAAAITLTWEAAKFPELSPQNFRNAQLKHARTE